MLRGVVPIGLIDISFASVSIDSRVLQELYCMFNPSLAFSSYHCVFLFFVYFFFSLDVDYTCLYLYNVNTVVYFAISVAVEPVKSSSHRS